MPHRCTWIKHVQNLTNSQVPRHFEKKNPDKNIKIPSEGHWVGNPTGPLWSHFHSSISSHKHKASETILDCLFHQRHANAVSDIKYILSIYLFLHEAFSKSLSLNPYIVKHAGNYGWASSFPHLPALLCVYCLTCWIRAALVVTVLSPLATKAGRHILGKVPQF